MIIVIYEGEGLRKAYDNPAGVDLTIKTISMSNFTDDLIMYKIKTGIKLQMPKGIFAVIKPRSSALKRGFIVTEGVVDNSYRGEIIVQGLMNKEGEEALMNYEDKPIAQLVFYNQPDISMKQGIVDNNTIRGDKGFGSSDK